MNAEIKVEPKEARSPISNERTEQHMNSIKFYSSNGSSRSKNPKRCPRNVVKENLWYTL
jgi:hypothetical protein